MDDPTPNQRADSLDRLAVVQTCRVLLRPVASLLLKCGMTWREFAEVSKSVFVAVAGDEYGLNGRPTNVSRVSILTGVSRKEVVRVRALLELPATTLPNKTTDATRLLSGWHQDAEFITASGQPRLLAVDGEGATFATLWQRYGGDVPLTSMRKELERAGAITTLPDGRLRAERRYFMPKRFDPQWILNAGSMLSDLGASITHNLDAGAESLSPGSDSPARRFIGRATNDSTDVAAMPEFEAFVEKNGQEFLERVDKWLTEHEAKPAAGGTRKRARLGLGVFLIAGD
jgi:hypothetical protein